MQLCGKCKTFSIELSLYYQLTNTKEYIQVVQAHEIFVDRQNYLYVNSKGNSKGNKR